MAKVMVVAGGAFQCPIVRTAKRMGHEVLCTNLYEDSPAFEFADAYAVADVLDQERNLQIARNWQPDAILTDQSDIAVPTVAYVAEKLGLRGIGQEAAALFHNKHLMREHTSRAGFPSPAYRLCHTSEEAIEFLTKYPTSIIKPMDSQSSRGVHIVRSADDIRTAFADCLQYSNTDAAILIEEYIEGTEFTVDGLKTEDTYLVTAISEKEHFAYNPSIASRLYFSHDNPRFDYDALRELNTRMVEAMGLPFGLTHAEYKYHDSQFYLIEIAARGGGTMISSDVVPLVSGIDSSAALIDTLLGNKPDLTPKAHHSEAVLGFFDFPAGKVTSISGLDEATGLPGVRCLSLELSIGDILGRAQDDRSRCGYYIIYADSPAELTERERLLKDIVRVETS